MVLALLILHPVPIPVVPRSRHAVNVSSTCFRDHPTTISVAGGVGYPRSHAELVKLNPEVALWDEQRASLAVAACESPARKCREGKSGKIRVRFSRRHEFRNRLIG